MEASDGRVDPTITSAAAGPLPDARGFAAGYWSERPAGMLSLAECAECHFFIHPPAPYCPACGGVEVDFSVVEGAGAVYAWTINHHQWLPAMDPPYVIALIDLDCQPGLRVLSNVVGIRESEMAVGLRVIAETVPRSGGLHLPIFRADITSSSEGGSSHASA
jgi:uncharacterized protein